MRWSCVSASALEHVTLLEEVRSLRSSTGPEVRLRKHPRPLRCVAPCAGSGGARRSDHFHRPHRGETGTGKELLAKAIHLQQPPQGPCRSSPSTAAPFPRSCSNPSFSATSRGAFTGAVADKKGKVETADGGTVFLDEIGEMPLELQVKLLRLIQQGEVAKVGARDHQRRCPDRRGDSSQPEGHDRGRHIPRGPLLPALRDPSRTAAAPRTRRKTSRNWCSISSREPQKHGRPDLMLPPALLPYFTALPMARQCARTGEHRGATGRPQPWRRDHPWRPARIASPAAPGSWKNCRLELPRRASAWKLSKRS